MLMYLRIWQLRIIRGGLDLMCIWGVRRYDSLTFLNESKDALTKILQSTYSPTSWQHITSQATHRQYIYGESQLCHAEIKCRLSAFGCPFKLGALLSAVLAGVQYGTKNYTYCLSAFTKQSKLRRLAELRR